MVAATVLLLIPPALWLAPGPAAGLVGTAAVALVGWAFLSLIWDQRREKALRHRAEERLTAVGSASAGAAGSLGIEQVLARSLDGTMEVTGLETGMIFLADRTTRELALGPHEGVSEESVAGLRRVPTDDGPLRTVLRSRGPVIFNDVSRVLPALHREGVRTAVLAPLRSKDSAQGILAVGSRTVREFLPEELELIMAIADQIGVAVDNAYLHREAGRKLQVQTRLNELAERIVSEIELDAIMPAVLSSAKELTGADGSGIALGDREGPRGSCSFSLPPDPLTGPIRAEMAVNREVTQTRRPVIIEDYPSYQGAIRGLVDAGLASLVGVPIVYGDHVFGTLTLFNFDRSKRFAEYDVVVAVELGRQTGIAVENAQLYQSMRFYVRQVTRAQEDERKRIARELHDETIQRLVLISRRLESLTVLSDQLPPAARERIAALEELLTDTMRGVRRFVQDLRPPMLDHLGLVASVEAIASDLRENNAIEAEVRVVGESRRLEPEDELVLFRIAQEALGNTRRHSGATEAEVRVEFRADLVRVTVSDNGCGFTVPERMDDYVTQGKLGLIGMIERARTLGGMLDVRSEPGRGARITVEIPSQATIEVDLSQMKR